MPDKSKSSVFPVAGEFDPWFGIHLPRQAMLSRRNKCARNSRLCLGRAQVAVASLLVGSYAP